MLVQYSLSNFAHLLLLLLLFLLLLLLLLLKRKAMDAKKEQSEKEIQLRLSDGCSYYRNMSSVSGVLHTDEYL